MKIALPEWELIPDIGLYLDQVNKFVNQYVPESLDMELTPTMITNYVKLKIVPKGIKKTYSRNQIAQFLIIAYLKLNFSMEQIKVIFAYYEMNDKVKDFYTLFIKGLKSEKVNDGIIASLTGSAINKIELDLLIKDLKAKTGENK